MRMRLPWGAGGARREEAEPPVEDSGPGLGERLREARRERGLTLGDAERDTRINRLYLEAIEAEDFRVLPAPVYARGFVRTYARYLGIDPDDAVRAVPKDLPRPRGLEPLPGLRRAPQRTIPELSREAMFAVAAVAVIALLAVAGYVLFLGGDGGGGAELVDGRGVVPDFREGATPDFTGVERDAAVAFLEELGLEPVVLETSDADVPAGHVASQSPSPGAPVDAGDVVTLFVSSGSGP